MVAQCSLTSRNAGDLRQVPNSASPCCSPISEVDDWKYTFIAQPNGWFGVVERPNIPTITNLRQDPYERMNWPSNGTANGSVTYWDSFKHEMWRFQVASQIIAANIPSFVEYPPMPAGAGFSTGDLKEKVEALIAASHAHVE